MAEQGRRGAKGAIAKRKSAARTAAKRKAGRAARIAPERTKAARKKPAKRSATRPPVRGSLEAASVALDAAVSRAEVRAEVVAKLAAVVQRDAKSLRDEQKLFEDLGMGAPLRSSMAKPYTKISQSHGGLPVTIDDAAKLKTVGESVDLVHRRSEGKS
jgi:hypothetical protein